ncbi:potassium channel family protein [Haliangium ochraceum]|uniref:TrkA-N domain protein n=1 Tax=Haliangium ochraceum (strain DSM 14365 / JCM 11303 / SMP-2) TaxID=502025 RepID=D0LJG5_HALO1|nr:TrkA family potassium uptake protein [Haliangium ochraceum]ACY16539.1 TrkA-N domain protein [Haliangium ochraceum DSM 14365]
MNKQAIVIGLGQFGLSVAHVLSERGMEVLAVDKSEARVRVAAEFVAEAACFDAMDSDALARTSPQRREVCLCAIGDESREASIICTALLRQMGAPRVIARGIDDLHARILRLVGAHQVVNPERQFGERFANHLLYERVRNEMPLGDDLLITEMSPPQQLIGRTLAEMALPRRFGITVVAIRRSGRGAVFIPESDYTLLEDDILVVVSRGDAVAKLMEKHRE